MTFKEYLLIHKEERTNADGCVMCKYEGTEPWSYPCSCCKRNARDLYERDNNIISEDEVYDERDY